MRALATVIAECIRESARIYWVLLRIALPLLIIIRLLDEYVNFIAVVGDLLSPLMSLVGLPGQAGIVWAAAALMQLYAALLLLVSLWAELNLSVAQATTLALMILVAHSLPIELRIAQRAGAAWWVMLLMRVGGALIFGALLNGVYIAGDWLQGPAVLHFVPLPPAPGWGAWFIGQAQNWAGVYVLIVALLIVIRILKATHAERLLIWLLSPLLRWMGIGQRAVTATMVGMTLGLSYGGGILIAESRRGDIERRDMLCALALLGLCHSVIEDTLLMMLINAHWSGVLIARVIFSFVFMMFFARLIKSMPQPLLAKFFLSKMR